MTLSTLIYNIKIEVPGDWENKKELFAALDGVHEQINMRPSLETHAIDMVTSVIVMQLGQPKNQWQQRIFNIINNSRS